MRWTASPTNATTPCFWEPSSSASPPSCCRTAELAAIRKKFDNETTANQQSAASIRLEKARKVVESTTAAVSAMTDLKNELDKAIDAGAADADIKQLAKQVGTVIEKLQDVRTNVEAIR